MPIAGSTKDPFKTDVSKDKTLRLSLPPHLHTRYNTTNLESSISIAQTYQNTARKILVVTPEYNNQPEGIKSIENSKGD